MNINRVWLIPKNAKNLLMQELRMELNDFEKHFDYR